MESNEFALFDHQHPYDQISSKALKSLKSAAISLEHSAGENIYQIGEKARGLYIVCKGKVEIADALGDVISILGEGNSFGERGLVTPEKLCVTQARAHSDCELVLIPESEFFQLYENEAEFERFFDRQSRVKRRINKAQDLAVNPISNVMSSPVHTITSDASVQDAAKMMREKKITCLPVVDDGEVQGLFTNRDLVYKVLAENKMKQSVKDIMSSPAMALPSSALVIDAMLEMTNQNIGHLLVMENGEIKGIVTQSNLVTRGANSLMGALVAIAQAKSAKEMVEPVKKLPELLAQMAGAGVDGFIVTRLLTDMADAVTSQLIRLYEREHGAAPAPYLWAACGSQGRQEQTGVSDQDNCIIYADGVEDASWYEGLAKYVCDGMDLVGYFYCPGDMMATNPKWCQSESTWREYFSTWVASPTEEAQMLASVMFDLRGIFGDTQLLTNIQEDVLEKAATNSIFLAYLISNSLKHQPPLSLFRNVSTIRDGEHKNTIDLKHSGVVPITDLARVYAIKGRIATVNTRARLNEAMLAGALSEAGGKDLIAAYDFIQEIRLRNQSRQIRQGEKPDNFVNPKSLSDLERSHLRDAFVVVKSMQSALSRQAAP